MSWKRRAGIAFHCCILAIAAKSFAATDVCQPALVGIAATPTSVVGGTQSIQLTLSFANPIPVGCPVVLGCSLSTSDDLPYSITTNLYCPITLQGKGTAELNLYPSFVVVNQTQTVTLDFGSRSTAITVTPVAIRAITLSPTQVEPGQTAVGTVVLEGTIGPNSRAAAVNISAAGPSNAANAVQVPSAISIACCTSDGEGHSIGMFNITAQPVAQDINVGILVNRPNQNPRRAFLTVRATTPTLSVQDVRVSEPHGFAESAAFTFALSQINPTGASVAFRMTGQTATRTSSKTCDGTGDFVLRSGVVTFGPTERTKIVTVPVCHDTRDEPDETFRIDLSNPVGLLAPDTVVIGTILDND